MTTTTINPLAPLREQYTALSGKRPFPGWKEEQLQEKIDAFNAPKLQKTWEEMNEEERIEEAKRINSRKPKLITEKMIPVFRNKKPFAIINDKYIPWEEAQVIHKEQQIKQLQEEILRLEADHS